MCQLGVKILCTFQLLNSNYLGGSHRFLRKIRYNLNSNSAVCRTATDTPNIYMVLISHECKLVENPELAITVMTSSQLFQRETEAGCKARSPRCLCSPRSSWDWTPTLQVTSTLASSIQCTFFFPLQMFTNKFQGLKIFID